MADVKMEVKKPVRPTESLLNGWKTIVASALAVGAIATCIYYPPAAIYLSPAVEFLVGQLSFAGIWAGLISFSTVVASIAVATFFVSELTLKGASALIAALTSTQSSPNEPQSPIQPQNTPRPPDSSDNDPLDSARNNHFGSPFGSPVSSVPPLNLESVNQSAADATRNPPSAAPAI